MKFLVTSVVWEDQAEVIGDACRHIGDWLNASLADTNYGSGISQVTFTVVATESESSENEARAKKWDKVGHFKDWKTSQPVRYLSFGLSLPYETIASLDRHGVNQAIASLVSEKLSARPKRLPKEFDFQRFVTTVRAAFQVYGPAA